MHPMLQVLAPPGLLYVNGRFVGETDGGGTPLSRDGAAYIEYRPINKWSPGIALRLDIEGGLLIDGLAEDVYAVQWPGGLLELEFRGDEALSESISHAQLKTPYGQLSLVERAGLLSLGYDAEHMTELPVRGPYANLGLRTQPHPSMPLVAITGSCDDGPFTVMVRLDQPPQVLQTIQGRSMDWSMDSTVSGLPRSLHATPSQTGREWLELTLAQDHSGAARLLTNTAYQQRFAVAVGEFDQVVTMRYPVPGLAPVEWGALKLITPQIAHVNAIGFVGQSEDEGWRIERIIPYGVN